MKKLLLLLSLFLVGCSSFDNVEQIVCTKEINEPLLIYRENTFFYKNNKIIKIESLDKLYFDDNFLEADFETLESELQDKLADEKNITYSFEYKNDHVILVTTITNIDSASSRELSFIGLEIEDNDFLVGLKETISFNEKNGFVCKQIDK